MTEVNHPKVQKILQSQTMAHLATIGPKGEPQSSPMWFVWDGESIKFTHTTDRQKYRNIKRDPRVSISITDVEDPCTYVAHGMRNEVSSRNERDGRTDLKK
jgi:PPOX class probable F420-dependent enzyme